ncbi:MAG: hypothetical protein QOD91_751 [Frankiales bacterium]|nr:hypothetical protein [Frankiales bacterium]
MGTVPGTRIGTTQGATAPDMAGPRRRGHGYLATPTAGRAASQEWRASLIDVSGSNRRGLPSVVSRSASPSRNRQTTGRPAPGPAGWCRVGRRRRRRARSAGHARWSTGRCRPADRPGGLEDPSDAAPVPLRPNGRGKPMMSAGPGDGSRGSRSRSPCTAACGISASRPAARRPWSGSGPGPSGCTAHTVADVPRSWAPLTMSHPATTGVRKLPSIFCCA